MYVKTKLLIQKTKRTSYKAFCDVSQSVCYGIITYIMYYLQSFIKLSKHQKCIIHSRQKPTLYSRRILQFSLHLYARWA